MLGRTRPPSLADGLSFWKADQGSASLLGSFTASPFRSRVSGRGNVLSTAFTHSACENTQEAAVLGACSEASAMPSQKSARSTTSCVVAVEGGPGWDASPTRTPRMGQPAQRSNLGTGRLMTRRRHLLRRGRPCQGLPQAALSALVACRLCGGLVRAGV